jgi:glycosyl hydrolase family 35
MKISIERDYLTLDGKPAFIFGGDFNYTRTPRRHWRDRLLKMKAAGMNTVTFYATWAFHEASQDGWDWTGDRDLGHFLDVIQEVGMWSIARLGPFVHGEWRNGGLPQWLMDELGPKVRTNAPEYLELTRKWYEQVLAIVDPRLATRGGPILIVQLENELGSAGSKGDDIARGSVDPEENAKHVLFYHKIIQDHGVDVPIIDINHFPGKEDIENLVDTGGVYITSCFGGEGEFPPMSTEQWEQHQRPRISIETMGGMFVRYFDWPPYRHTRGYQGPIVKPEFVEAITYHHLAEGYNGINYYVFVDGQHCDDGEERMLPARDMNFQAPITVVGSLRESYRVVKRTGWFLRAFGQEVLKSQPHASWVSAASYGRAHPGREGTGDLFEGYHQDSEPVPDHLRHVRKVECLGRATRGLNLSESNFAFLLNTKVHGSQWQRDIRLLTNPSGIPCEVWQEYPKLIQLGLPAQRNKCLPFFVRLASRTFLEYSTAELLDRRPYGEGVQVILHADADEMTETSLVLPRQGNVRKRGEAMALWQSPNTLQVLSVPGPDLQIICVDGDAPLRLVLMERELAGEVWDVDSPHGMLVAASNMRLLGSRVEDGHTTVQIQTDEPDFDLFLLTPSRPSLRGPFIEVTETYDAEFGLYRASGTTELPQPQMEFSRRKEDAAYVWETEITPQHLSGLRDLVLHAEYEGTSAKATLDGRLISDHAYGGNLFWEIGLRDWIGDGGLLRIEFEGCRKAETSVRPLVEFGVELDW